MRLFLFIFVTLTVFVFVASGYAGTEWSILVSAANGEEEGIKVAVADLVNTGKQFDVIFNIDTDTTESFTNAIIVGDTFRNRITADLQEKGIIRLEGVEDPEGYEIITITKDDAKTIVVSGGSVLGDVYGLYWIWDRLRVFKELPEINVKREPVLKYRYTRISVNSKEDIRTALRYGLNLVYGMNPLSLVPWSAEPERTENEKNRQITKELADYAHSLHLKFLAIGTDFTYHPSILEEFGASLSPSDPCFWDAVQAKYRRLFQAMPELDGMKTFLGEEQAYWGNYQTFDPIHAGEGCDWSLEKRYRTFVKKLYNVVVGEFDKLYLQRTWVTNCYEQQSQPEVYKKIFTADVPIRNLFLIPSFTQNDRWWYQAYNPTLNLTPHHMMAVFEPMDYHAGSNVFPTFPGQYFQAGMQTILDVKESNLKGASLDVPGGDDWGTRSVTAYTVSRLEWDYHEDVRTIATDFCSIHFGKAAAAGMADIYLMSPVAYKYGLYIEPAAYGAFNSLPHIRVGQFIAEGYPRIDNGKEHIEFLRTLYLRCKPWIPETLDGLDHGFETAKAMEKDYQSVKPLIEDPELANQVETSLKLTRLLIQTNNLYVRTFLSYFTYREHPTSQNRALLQQSSTELKDIRKEFIETPGFGYQLFGVDQLLSNVDQILEDFTAAEERLAKAFTSQQIEAVVSEQQRKYVEVMKEFPKEAIKILHWEGRVDGRDIIRIRDKQIEIEHLRWDPMYFKDYTILNPLPKQAVTVIPMDIESRPMHPFILRQPSSENDYTASVYLYDIPGGAGWCKFDLYYIAKSPKELGLEIPW
ncbi:MAG: hypothetical protein ABIH23_09760 [bacterium]